MPADSTNQVWLQVGLNQREQLIHISESPRGDDCGLICPYCREPLMAKKGRIKIHHFAHLTNSCRPAMPKFDFWATHTFDISLPLDEFACRHRQQLNLERSGLQELVDNQTGACRQLKIQVDDLVSILSAISRPFKDGTRPLNRQRNYDVLQEVQTFLESPTADRGPVPALYTVRHSRFEKYLIMYFHKGQWGQPRYTCSPLYQSELWQYDKPGSYIIPNRLDSHYDALAAYHKTRNNYTDLVQEQEAFERQYERFQQFSFYFLRVHIGMGTLYKVGVTSRMISERVAEIQSELRSLGITGVDVVTVVPHAGFLESYFKRKYASHQHVLDTAHGPLTEYFDLTGEIVEEIQAALYQLIRPISRSETIRTAMRRQQQAGVHIGRPKGIEQHDAFLQKPKSRQIAELIRAGHPLREVERQTGYSINTIRKVNEVLKPPTYHLADLIRAKRGKRGVNAVAEEINGQNLNEMAKPSTIARAENGFEPAPDLLVALCQWLGVLPDQLKPFRPPVVPKQLP